MNKGLFIIVSIIVLLACFVFNFSNANEETNAKSILNSVQAFYSSNDEFVDVTIQKVEFIKEQTAHNHDYSYFIVQTDAYDWGYAELRNGEVLTFRVGYSRSEAKTRCKDCAEYRTTPMGGIGQ